MWTTTAAAISDLRRLLSDGPTDKLAEKKLVFGKVNAVNVLFKTFERRRFTDFSVVPVGTSPEGVYVNDVLVSPGNILNDDLTSGSFRVNVAPDDGDEIRATYYYRWFLDDELDQFLTNACQWLGFGTDYTKIADGLIPSALHYAAQEAYDRLALWWSTKISTAFMLDDAPDAQNQGVIDSYNKLADKMRAKATELRNDFYTRQGQSLAPLFLSSPGTVRDYVPRR